MDPKRVSGSWGLSENQLTSVLLATQIKLSNKIPIALDTDKGWRLQYYDEN